MRTRKVNIGMLPWQSTILVNFSCTFVHRLIGIEFLDCRILYWGFLTHCFLWYPLPTAKKPPKSAYSCDWPSFLLIFPLFFFSFSFGSIFLCILLILYSLFLQRLWYRSKPVYVLWGSWAPFYGIVPSAGHPRRRVHTAEDSDPRHDGGGFFAPLQLLLTITLYTQLSSAWTELS